MKISRAIFEPRPDRRPIPRNTGATPPITTPMPLEVRGARPAPAFTPGVAADATATPAAPIARPSGLDGPGHGGPELDASAARRLGSEPARAPAAADPAHGATAASVLGAAFGKPGPANAVKTGALIGRAAAIGVTLALFGFAAFTLLDGRSPLPPETPAAPPPVVEVIRDPGELAIPGLPELPAAPAERPAEASSTAPSLGGGLPEPPGASTAPSVRSSGPQLRPELLETDPGVAPPRPRGPMLPSFTPAEPR